MHSGCRRVYEGLVPIRDFIEAGGPEQEDGARVRMVGWNRLRVKDRPQPRKTNDAGQESHREFDETRDRSDS